MTQHTQRVCAPCAPCPQPSSRPALPLRPPPPSCPAVVAAALAGTQLLSGGEPALNASEALAADKAAGWETGSPAWVLPENATM